MLDARAIHRVARGEVVRAVEQHVALRGKLVQFLGLDARRDRDDLDVGVGSAQRARGGKDLLRADRVGAIEDLALQVGEVDLVAVGEAQSADAGCGEIKRCGTTEPTRADDKDLCRAKLLLPLDADLVEKDVSAVAEKLLVVNSLLCSGRPSAP